MADDAVPRSMEKTEAAKAPPHGADFLAPWTSFARMMAETARASSQLMPGSGGNPFARLITPLPAEDGPSEDRPGPTRAIDRLIHATMGRATFGLSPAGLALAYADWWIHLASQPGKQAELAEKAYRKAVRLSLYAARAALDPANTPAAVRPLPGDRRFIAEEWQRPPYNIMSQAFLMAQQWWHGATHDVRGVDRRHLDMVAFGARQWLDLFAPSNLPWLNPEIAKVTAEEGGANLVRGAVHLIEDWERQVTGKPPVGTESFKLGEDLATTPGEVIYRNSLIEVIQYSPTTDKVQAEPILIVPAWIMKYYILDLSPHNSMVKYLVDQGHTVFMISWKNPGPEDRDYSMSSYRRHGVMDAIDAVAKIVPDRKIHTVGYCIGGTLLSIAAADMAKKRDDRLASITLFAAQTDFTEAGELMLFIDEAQLAYLEDIMWDQGTLDTKQMAGAFQMLRSNDLIWSQIAHTYLMGEREPMIDLMAWNADATRMPYRMHSEYLRQLFLDNDLAAGRYRVDGRPIALVDIRQPMFVVGTETDHVAPWRSVFKINLLTDTDITFCLTSGGHNAGIVAGPENPRRRHRLSLIRGLDPLVDPDTWFERTEPRKGSWWPAWVDWLKAHSSGPVDPPATGAPEKGLAAVAAAPGSYVRMT